MAYAETKLMLESMIELRRIERRVDFSLSPETAMRFAWLLIHGLRSTPGVTDEIREDLDHYLSQLRTHFGLHSNLLTLLDRIEDPTYDDFLKDFFKQ